MTDTIGDRLRRARQDRRLSLGQAAYKTGIPKASILEYEKGRGIPSHRLGVLSAAYRVSTDWLIHGPEAVTWNDPAFDGVLRAVTTITGVNLREILGRRRSLAIVAARHAVVWLAYHRLALPKAEIGRRLGIHHSSVIHALEAVSAWLVTADRRATVLEAIASHLNEREQAA